MTRQQAISRQCAAGVPHIDIAAEFGITPAQVLLIDRMQQSRRSVRRVAEPYQAPKPVDWKTARPAVERLRTGDTCRAPDCCGRIERGSYCGHHASLFYVPRAA